MADDDLGTAVADEPVDPGTETIPAPDPTAAAASATDPSAKPADVVESFINPAELPEEIKPHWKRMHAAYTKWIEKERNPSRADLDMLAKFRSDNGFALEMLQLEATRRGLTLAPANGAPSTAAAPTGEVATTGDRESVARIAAAMKDQIDPSLHWMIPSMAAGQWAAAREASRPLVEKDAAKDKAARDSEWGALSGKLTETAPGWEAHETDMTALLDWLQSPTMTHPQYGDKLTFLYNAVTNGGQAKAAAIRAMGDAARNATRTGQSGRATIPNVTDRVRKATTQQDAMRVAAEEAERELRAAGQTVPD